MTQAAPETTTRVQQPEAREEWRVTGDELVANTKRLLHEGHVRRVIIRREGQTAMEIPLTVAIIGTLLAPWLAAIGAMVALLTNCTIEVVRTEHPGEPPTA